MSDKFDDIELENTTCNHHHHDECGCDDNCEDSCGCGCDHDHDLQDIIYVTFDDEDSDEEVPCVVLDIFECNDREYIAISPKEDVDNEEADIYFYRFSEDGEEVHLDDIETDAEWEAVAEVFDKNFFQLE